MPGIPRWCLATIVLVWACVFLAHGFLERWLVDTSHRRAIDEHLQSEVDNFQGQLDRQIARMIDAANQVAGEPRTAEILVDSNQHQESDWQKLARTLNPGNPLHELLSRAKARLPGAERVFLLDPRVNPSPLPGNYVAELLIRTAFEGEAPPPRAARTEQWNVYLARPVRAGDNVTGVLLVEYDPSALRNALRPDAALPGRASLIQSVQGFPSVPVISQGTGWRDEYSLSADTMVPEWKVKFTASKELVDSVRPGALPLYLALGALVILAAAISGYLVKRNLVFPKAEVKRPAKLNPLDDLFTEKHVRAEPPPPRPAASSPPAAPPPPAGPAPRAPASAAPPQDNSPPLPVHVFRDYDIRGKAGSEITPEFAELLGKAVGTLLLQEGQHCLAVAADGRNSSPQLKRALCEGILTTGCDLIDLGDAPTPVLNFALATLDECTSGIMVTASHNPKEDNGFKIMINRLPLSGDAILQLRTRMTDGGFTKAHGDRHEQEVISHYIDQVVGELAAPGNLRIAIDCANGIASLVAPDLFRALGCEVTELYTTVDGNFPNHPPDPTVSRNLAALVKTVVDGGLDLGLAFDGDGDRVVAITGTGRIVWPDELLMIFARDVVARHPGANIIYDVKSTRRLHDLISSYGGNPVMWKTGHAHMRTKVHDSGAPLGGEFSGHLFFNDRWFGFDDGLYAAARLLEIIGIREQSLDDIIASFPPAVATEEIRIAIDEGRKDAFVEAFVEISDFGAAERNTLDGLRVEYDDGWGLIRASNTAAALTFRFEADTEAGLAAVVTDFRTKLENLDTSVARQLAKAAATARA